MRSLATFILGIALATAGASVTFAAEPGVHVDPDSPAGKEYAIPIDRARRDAGGGGTADRSGGGGTPLFGAGIARSGGSGAGGATGSRSGHRIGSGQGKAAKKDESGGRDVSVAEQSASAGSGNSTVLTSGAIGLAVLLAGGAAALLLRRGLRN